MPSTPEMRCCPPTDPSDTTGPAMYLTYIETTGRFWNTYLAGGLGDYDTLINYVWFDAVTGNTYTLPDAYGKCIRTQPSPNGYGKLYDPIACPDCCPDSFQFADWRLRANSTAGTPCISIYTPWVYRESVPCITCVCPEPPPEPEPCTTCTQSQGLHIAFSYDPTRKKCIDCELVGEPIPLPGGAGQFMPIQLQDPIINFRLRT